MTYNRLRIKTTASDCFSHITLTLSFPNLLKSLTLNSSICGQGVLGGSRFRWGPIDFLIYLLLRIVVSLLISIKVQFIMDDGLDFKAKSNADNYKLFDDVNTLV